MIVTHFNYEPKHVRNIEPQSGASETVPAQGMTIPELIDRYTRGYQVTTHKPIWYDESQINEFEGQFDGLDKLERQDLLKQVKSEIAAKQAGAQEFLRESAKARKKKEAIEKAKENAKPTRVEVTPPEPKGKKAPSE